MATVGVVSIALVACGGVVESGAAASDGGSVATGGDTAGGRGGRGTGEAWAGGASGSGGVAGAAASAVSALATGWGHACALLDGGGFKEGAKDWLRRQVDDKLVHVFNMMEFQRWTNSDEF